MSDFNRITLGKQSAEFGFVRDTFEKVCRLAELLDFFESNPVLSRFLALKGGTAINLTIFDLPRLSVDIDLDFSENLSLSETESIREEMSFILEQQMESSGYERSIVKSKRYHTLDSFVYYYTNAGQVRDNIKVEINYSLRSHPLPLQVQPLKTLGIFKPVNVLSLAPLEIFAAKTAALLSRAAVRDLYDINNMIYYRLIDKAQEALLRKCAVFYIAVSSDTIPNEIEFGKMEAITQYKVKTDLYPVIRKQERFDLEAAKTRVREYLSGLLTLSTDERLFLSAFQKNEYLPDLLFDGDILERVKNHPMALWKTQLHEH